MSMKPRWTPLKVSFTERTDISRMRCNILLISLVAPSAVCSNETASPAFLTAWLSDLISAFIQEAMAMPAASSLEELMRLPVDIRSIATDKGRSFACSDALAIKALTFVLITGIKFF